MDVPPQILLFIGFHSLSTPEHRGGLVEGQWKGATRRLKTELGELAIQSVAAQ